MQVGNARVDHGHFGSVGLHVFELEIVALVLHGDAFFSDLEWPLREPLDDILVGSWRATSVHSFLAHIHLLYDILRISSPQLSSTIIHIVDTLTQLLMVLSRLRGGAQWLFTFKSRRLIK